MSRSIARREVLKRMGACGAAAAAVAGAGVWLHGRTPRGTSAPAFALPSWAAPMKEGAPDMVIARGTPAARLVEAALEELGGMQRFVGPGDRVLIKPNAAFDRPAWQGSTTNPDVLEAVARACIGAGAAEVWAADNPIHVPEGCFRKTGLGKATEDGGGRVWLPRAADFGPVALPGTVLDGWSVFLEPLKRATKVIGIAPVKDHNLARASMTLKNWYGLLGGPRNRLHQKLDETIATLAGMVRPTLSVLDGTRILLRNGPTGGSPEDVVNGDVIAMGTDGVALDAFGVELLGAERSEVPYLELAGGLGHGTPDWTTLETREVRV